MRSSTEVVTLKQRSDLEEQVDRLAGGAWPAFMLHTDMPYWRRLFDDFALFQVLFLGAEGPLVALGHTIPFT